MNKEKTPRSGILIIHSMGIGDLVLALPIIKVLKRHYLNEEISFLTNEKNSDILTLLSDLKEIISYRNKTLPELFRLISRVRHNRYRLVIVLNPVFYGSLLAWLSGAPVRVGYIRDFERTQSAGWFGWLSLTHRYVPINQERHESERNLDILRMFGIPVKKEDTIPSLSVNDEVRNDCKTLIPWGGAYSAKPLVVINPGAGWEMRRWPFEKFANICDWLVDEYGSNILFVGDTFEKSNVQKIQAMMKQNSSEVCGKTTLSQLTALLSLCDLFITNDTGAMHIAAAMDIPTIALFGPGNPSKVRPLSSRAKVICHKIPCNPCNVQYTSLCGFNLCMKQISAAEVKNAIIEIFSTNENAMFLKIDIKPNAINISV